MIAAERLCYGVAEPMNATPFKGKIALITGASRGIGRATALRLAEGGADVVVHYRQNEAHAREVASAVEALGRRGLAVRADLEKPEEIRALFATVGGELGALDIFVANAAATVFRDVLDLKDYNVIRTYQITVLGFIQSVQAAVRLMEGRNGRIVTLSSFPMDRYLPGYATLASAKAAVETLTRYLACELAGRGINVNCVSPGLVLTDSSKIYGGEDYERFERAIVEATPKGRAGTPDDIARVIAFLCSDDAEWITGQTIMVDGGMTLTLPYLRRP